jgi:conjugative transfer region lipoprotein (TIGR03751 family)
MIISIKHLTTIALISGAAIALSGCSGFVKPPKGAPTMAQVYAAGNAGESNFYNAGDDPISSGSVVRPTATSTLPEQNLAKSKISNAGIVSTLNSQFPTLPNPQSLMYIFGHYAGNGHLPVPGHFVSFALYNHTYYALPNEVMTPYNDGQFIR